MIKEKERLQLQEVQNLLAPVPVNNNNQELMAGYI